MIRNKTIVMKLGLPQFSLRGMGIDDYETGLLFVC